MARAARGNFRRTRLPIAILLHALYSKVENVTSFHGVPYDPRRLLMLGRPGAGKSFVQRLLVRQTLERGGAVLYVFLTASHASRARGGAQRAITHWHGAG